MVIYGEYGEVETITCTIDPEKSIVVDGKLFELSSLRLRAQVRPDDRFNDEGIPDNCPRGPRFDADLRLGCVACPRSIIDYGGWTEV